MLNSVKRDQDMDDDSSGPSFRAVIPGITASHNVRSEETTDWIHPRLDELRREQKRQDALQQKNNARLVRERQEAERKWAANQAELQAQHEESSQSPAVTGGQSDEQRR